MKKPALAALALLLSLGLARAAAPALSLGWYPGDACDDAAAQNPGDPSGCRYGARERDCGNAVDDDSDERADCADPDCGKAPWCAAACVPTADAEDCAAAGDEDCDGLADLDDPDCAGDCADDWWEVWLPACPSEECFNRADDDRDGLADCDDPDCAETRACVPEDCGNGQDDNADGWFDCLDADCRGAAACAAVAWEDCRYGTGDEDGDGLADCEDPSCEGFWACGEICVPGSGIDEDGNGLADCQDGAGCADAAACWYGGCDGTRVCDPSCPEYVDVCLCQPEAPWCPPPPAPEVCYNGKDDDRDGAADCADPECANLSWCRVIEPYCADEYAANAGKNGACVPERAETNCADGRNNDASEYDEQADCDDPDCAGAAACACDGTKTCDPSCPEYDPADPRCGGGNGEDCANLIDDDGDGFIDCVDSDCALYTKLCGGGGAMCTDGVDNDNDGKIDSADNDMNPECPIDICHDGVDNDGDGDADEPEGWGNPPAECPPVETDCFDGIDNDDDGDADCADIEDCDYATRLEETYSEPKGLYQRCEKGKMEEEIRKSWYKCEDQMDNDENSWVDCADTACHEEGSPCLGESGYSGGCSDHQDNDNDGDVDCDDQDCKDSLEGCSDDHETSCEDGIDNEGDGKIDCADDECFGMRIWKMDVVNERTSSDCGCGPNGGEVCFPVEQDFWCFDKTDNDKDGDIDKKDPDCKKFYDGIGAEICDNYVDDDTDGLVDCADPICYFDARCKEADCSDGYDNDKDGEKDCKDVDCLADPACQ